MKEIESVFTKAAKDMEQAILALKKNSVVEDRCDEMLEHLRLLKGLFYMAVEEVRRWKKRSTTN